MYHSLFKRLLDLMLVIPALVLLTPVYIMLALLVRFKLGSPILFRQTRPGHNGQPFTLYKFRTMIDIYDTQGQLLPDEERLPAFGRWLRSSSLDELPELVNVLTGEMSLVGPRPLLLRYLDRYIPEHMRRHEVRPGLTGLAQISGRNALSWEAKLDLDLQYVDRISFWLDLSIIVQTVWKIRKREGISQPGQATMEEFLGSDAGTP